MIQVIQMYSARARADAGSQTNPAGLVAIVAAVIDVVRPEQTRHQLQQKAGFVGGPTAGVEETAFGTRRLHSVCHALQSLIPVDGTKVGTSLFQQHRFDNATAVLQLPRRQTFQLVNVILLPKR